MKRKGFVFSIALVLLLVLQVSGLRPMLLYPLLLPFAVAGAIVGQRQR